MKIVHIVPGSGGTFYCQNCMRDNELIKSLKTLGHEIYMVPMYLPISVDDHETEDDTPVFYGAINIYLKEKLPFYRHAPIWLEKIFDSQPLLKYAAKKSGSTRASGLEEMTISMLKGEEGRQATELDHLIKFLQKEIQPDVVHLSNALLLGLAKRMKEEGEGVVLSEISLGAVHTDEKIPKGFWLRYRTFGSALSWHNQRFLGRRWYKKNVR